MNRTQPRIMMISTHGYVAADPPLGAPDTGGQVVFVLELSKKLAQFGYSVDIWTRGFENQPQEETVNDSVRIIRVSAGGNEFIPKERMNSCIPELVKNAVKIIRKEKLHYQFINSHYWDGGYAGLLLAEDLNIPHIHTPHSLGSWKREQMRIDYPGHDHELDEKYNFPARIAMETSIFSQCDSIVATSPVQKDLIEKDYGILAGKIVTIPPGYDDTRFYPVGEASRTAIRARLGFEGKVVFAVSRLAENKGLDLLIEAFALLCSRIDDAQLYLAIGHENRNEQEEIIYQKLLTITKERNIEDRVHFTGFISDEDLPDYYRAADIFVLSSRYEPFGMTAVEAMASGTPSVITIHGGLSRMLDYGIHCLMADPLDREELGMNMVTLLKYPDLYRRIRHKAAQRVRARFTWTGIAQSLLRQVEQFDETLEPDHE